MGLTIHPRSSWGAVAPRYRNTMAPSQCQYAVIHYSAMPGTTTQSIRNVQAFHMGPDRGWSDIAYNFVVLPNGEVYEGRGWEVKGGHAVGYNSNSVAIVAMLGATETATQAMKNSIRAWRDYANKRYGRTLKTMCHRDLPGNSTDCPGPSLTPWVRAGLPVNGAAVVDDSLLRLTDPYMSGKSVEFFQTIAALKGFTPKDFKVDGVYGPATEAVCKAIQKKAGLDVDGVAGPKTLDWLGKYVVPKPAPVTPAKPKPPVAPKPPVTPTAVPEPFKGVFAKPGDTGPLVAVIQNSLNVVSKQGLVVDGSYGPATSLAVKNFQNFVKAPVTGTVDAKTMATLQYFLSLKG